MNIQDVEDYVTANAEDCEVGTPATENLIQSAESELGLHFPEDYREFLLRYNTLSIGPLEFMGIAGKEKISSILDVVGVTKRLRERLDLPNNLLIFLASSPIYYCIDCNSSPSFKITMFDSSKKIYIETPYKSISDFIIEEARDSF